MRPCFVNWWLTYFSTIWYKLSTGLFCMHGIHACIIFQEEHLKCPTVSPCHFRNYTPSKTKLTDPKTVGQLEKQLKDTYIYREAESFCRVQPVDVCDSVHVYICSVEIHIGSRASTTSCCLTSQRESTSALEFLP